MYAFRYLCLSFVTYVFMYLAYTFRSLFRFIVMYVASLWFLYVASSFVLSLCPYFFRCGLLQFVSSVFRSLWSSFYSYVVIHYVFFMSRGRSFVRSLFLYAMMGVFSYVVSSLLLYVCVCIGVFSRSCLYFVSSLWVDGFVMSSFM